MSALMDDKDSAIATDEESVHSDSITRLKKVFDSKDNVRSKAPGAPKSSRDSVRPKEPAKYSPILEAKEMHPSEIRHSNPTTQAASRPPKKSSHRSNLQSKRQTYPPTGQSQSPAEFRTTNERLRQRRNENTANSDFNNLVKDIVGNDSNKNVTINFYAMSNPYNPKGPGTGETFEYINVLPQPCMGAGYVPPLNSQHPTATSGVDKNKSTGYVDIECQPGSDDEDGFQSLTHQNQFWQQSGEEDTQSSTTWTSDDKSFHSSEVDSLFLTPGERCSATKKDTDKYDRPSNAYMQFPRKYADPVSKENVRKMGSILKPKYNPSSSGKQSTPAPNDVLGHLATGRQENVDDQDDFPFSRHGSTRSAPPTCLSNRIYDTVKSPSRKSRQTNPKNTLFQSSALTSNVAPPRCEGCTQVCNYVLPISPSSISGIYGSRKSDEFGYTETEYISRQLREANVSGKYCILDVYDSPTSPYVLLYLYKEEVLRFPVSMNKDKMLSIAPVTKRFSCLCKLKAYYTEHDLPSIGGRLVISPEITPPAVGVSLNPDMHKPGVYEIVNSALSPVTPFTLRVVVGRNINNFYIAESSKGQSKKKLSIGPDGQSFSCQCKLVRYYQKFSLPNTPVNLTRSLREFTMIENNS